MRYQSIGDMLLLKGLEKVAFVATLAKGVQAIGSKVVGAVPKKARSFLKASTPSMVGGAAVGGAVGAVTGGLSDDSTALKGLGKGLLGGAASGAGVYAGGKGWASLAKKTK